MPGGVGFGVIGGDVSDLSIERGAWTSIAQTSQESQLPCLGPQDGRAKAAYRLLYVVDASAAIAAIRLNQKLL
jgi:hypothetical protein